MSNESRRTITVLRLERSRAGYCVGNACFGVAGWSLFWAGRLRPFQPLEIPHPPEAVWTLVRTRLRLAGLELVTGWLGRRRGVLRVRCRVLRSGCRTPVVNNL